MGIPQPSALVDRSDAERLHKKPEKPRPDSNNLMSYWPSARLTSHWSRPRQGQFVVISPSCRARRLTAGVRPCGREGTSPRPGDPRTTAPPRLSTTEEPQEGTSKTGTSERGKTSPSTTEACAAPNPLLACARSAGGERPAGARWRVGAEQALASDGPQRPFVGWRGFVLCGPRLTRGVRLRLSYSRRTSCVRRKQRGAPGSASGAG